MSEFKLEFPASVPDATKATIEGVLVDFLAGLDSDFAEVGDVRRGRLGWLRDHLRDQRKGLEPDWATFRVALADALSGYIRKAMLDLELEHAKARSTEIGDALRYMTL